MARTPFVIVGDAPAQTTGLSRIAGDLARHLVRDADTLNLDVRSVGYLPWRDLPLHGVPVDLSAAGVDWPVWGFSDLRTWGTEAVTTAYRHWFGPRWGVILTVWDAGRCLGFSQIGLPVDRWGYFPVDAENLHGTISGPAAEAIHAYDRVLAYSPFGAKVLSTLGRDVPHLPHGINMQIFRPEMTEAEHTRAVGMLGATDLPVLGCVVTNQRRKDLGVWMQVLKRLRETGHPMLGWLHINKLVTEAWSVPQLIEDGGLDGSVSVTTSLSDRELACLYALCTVTFAPGQGEGFGYPIVESQACGCPAVHCRYGGGADFTPYTVIPELYHLEGPYAEKRPILNPVAVASDISTLCTGRMLGEYTQAECRKVVQGMDWPVLWPRWRQWVVDGLEAR